VLPTSEIMLSRCKDTNSGETAILGGKQKTNARWHIFHCFAVHFNSMNCIHQLMHFYIQ